MGSAPPSPPPPSQQPVQSRSQPSPPLMPTPAGIFSIKVLTLFDCNVLQSEDPCDGAELKLQALSGCAASNSSGSAQKFAAHICFVMLLSGCRLLLRYHIVQGCTMQLLWCRSEYQAYMWTFAMLLKYKFHNIILCCLGSLHMLIALDCSDLVDSTRV